MPEPKSPDDTGLPATASCLVCFASCSLHAAGAYATIVAAAGNGPDLRWRNQILLGLGLSIVASITINLLRPAGLRGAVAALRLTWLVLLLAPYAESLGMIKTPIVMALGLELIAAYPFPYGVAFGMVAALTIWSPTAWMFPWVSELVVDRPIGSNGALAYSAFFLALAALARSYAERRTKQDAQVRGLRDSIRKLTDANTGFQRYIRIAEDNSKIDERRRIVRDLHDSIGYTLTTIIMLGESCLERSKRENREPITQLLEQIRDNAKDGLTDVRMALRVLKARADRTPDANQLQKLVKAFETATAVKVDCDFGNVPFLFAEATGRLVFRIVQEGLVNAFRHGHASEIALSLWISDGRLLVRIRDNGRSGEGITEGLGLSGMHERVEAVGGHLSYETLKTGFILTVDLPADFPEASEPAAQTEQS